MLELRLNKIHRSTSIEIAAYLRKSSKRSNVLVSRLSYSQLMSAGSQRGLWRLASTEQFPNLLLGLLWPWEDSRIAICLGMIYHGSALVSFNSYPPLLRPGYWTSCWFSAVPHKAPDHRQRRADCWRCWIVRQTRRWRSYDCKLHRFTQNLSLTSIDSPLFLQVQPRRSSSRLRSCAHWYPLRGKNVSTWSIRQDRYHDRWRRSIRSRCRKVIGIGCQGCGFRSNFSVRERNARRRRRQTSDRKWATYFLYLFHVTKSWRYVWLISIQFSAKRLSILWETLVLPESAIWSLKW